MATIIDDRIRTGEYDTRFDLNKFVKDTRNLLSYAGVEHFLAAIDIQAYTNGRAGLGRGIAPHSHILFWTEGPMPADARARLEGTRRFTSLTNAPTVVITERASDPGQIAHWAQYIFKAPERAANMAQRRDRSEAITCRDAFLEPILAVRLMEILSQLPLQSLVYAGGTGRHYRERIVRVIERHSHHRGTPLCPAVTLEIWARTWRMAGIKKDRTPIKFGTAGDGGGP